MGKRPFFATASGVTRLVFLVGKYAIKIPNFTFSWRNFVNGLCANIDECNTWGWCNNKHLLCPILWSSWGGWIVVMKRVDEVLDGRGPEFWLQVPEHINHFPGDDKGANYGVLDGRIVKIDYAFTGK